MKITVKEAVRQSTIDNAQQELYSTLKSTFRYVSDNANYLSNVSRRVGSVYKQYTLDELQKEITQLQEFAEGTIKEMKTILNELSRIDNTLR